MSTVRGRRAVALARKLDDPKTSASGAASVDRRLSAVMDEVRSLRVSAPEVGGGEPAEKPAESGPVDAVAKARAAREARLLGGAG